MFTDRRSYSLSKDQPILQQARRRRSSFASRVQRPESEFWKSFNLEKFARDWGGQIASAKARG